MPEPMSDADLAAIRERVEATVTFGSQVEPQIVRDERALLAEVDRLHSWDGLMSILDEHYPESIFPTEPDREDRDSGPRIISLIRQVDRLRVKETGSEWEYGILHDGFDEWGASVPTMEEAQGLLDTEPCAECRIVRRVPRREAGSWEPVVAGDPESVTSDPASDASVTVSDPDE